MPKVDEMAEIVVKQPTLTIGLLGVEVPPEFGGRFDAGVMAYLTAMRIEEAERRILAIEATMRDGRPERSTSD